MELNPNWLAAPIAIPLIAAAMGLPFTRWGYLFLKDGFTQARGKPHYQPGCGTRVQHDRWFNFH